MIRILCSIAAIAVAQVILTAPTFAEEKKPVKAVKEWNGSVADDDAAASGETKVITDATGLEKLWTAWKLEGKAPEVDFKKEFVAVITSRGSRLSFFTKSEEDGSLSIGGLGTRDLRPGTRYVIGTFSREGVKTVNGKELK